MLQSIQERYGEKLRASDGEIGHVRDFYFDDKNWIVRYLMADTGGWLAGRLVLISPHALGHLYPEGKVLLVNLTRQQIENSPSIDEAKQQSGDSHLRSARAVNGYAVEASDGTVGEIADFLIDGRTWVIREIVVECGHWYAGKKVIVSTDKVSRISYDQSTVYVDSTKRAFTEASERAEE